MMCKRSPASQGSKGVTMSAEGEIIPDDQVHCLYPIQHTFIIQRKSTKKKRELQL